MLICVNCEKVFNEDEIKVVTEPHGEQFGVCPGCSEDYEEAVRCEGCDEWRLEDDCIDTGNGETYCEGCTDNMVVCDHCESYYDDTELTWIENEEGCVELLCNDCLEDYKEVTL